MLDLFLKHFSDLTPLLVAAVFQTFKLPVYHDLLLLGVFGAERKESVRQA